MSDVAAAISGELAGWHGLRSGFGEPELRAEVRVQWRERAAPAERVALMYRVLDGTRPGPPDHLEAWIRVGEEPINSLEFRPPDDIGHAAILADLGAPELVLPSNFVGSGASVSDHVHAARGITLAVAEPLEHAGRSASIAYVQLYAPTDEQGYVVRVGQAGYQLRPFTS